MKGEDSRQDERQFVAQHGDPFLGLIMDKVRCDDEASVTGATQEQLDTLRALGYEVEESGFVARFDFLVRDRSDDR